MWNRIIIAFSVNYVVNLDDISIEDPTESLKTYEDEKTASGNKIQVSVVDGDLSPLYNDPGLANALGYDSASFARTAEGKG